MWSTRSGDSDLASAGAKTGGANHRRFAQILTSEQLLNAHRRWWCFCVAHLLLLILPPETPRPCLLTVSYSKIYTICRASLIAIQSPAPETTYEKGHWIEVVPCLLFVWCCFYYFVRNSLIALLEALCARILSLDSWISVFFWHFFFVCVCARSLTKSFFCPFQPGSCAWLLPFLLCADCTYVLVCVCLSVCMWTCVSTVINI